MRSSKHMHVNKQSWETPYSFAPLSRRSYFSALSPKMNRLQCYSIDIDCDPIAVPPVLSSNIPSEHRKGLRSLLTTPEYQNSLGTSNHSSSQKTTPKAFEYTGSPNIRFIDEDVIVDSTVESSNKQKWTSTRLPNAVPSRTYPRHEDSIKEPRSLRFDSISFALPSFESSSILSRPEKKLKSEDLDTKQQCLFVSPSSTLPRFNVYTPQKDIEPLLPTSSLPRFSSSVLSRVQHTSTLPSYNASSTESALESVSRSSSMKSGGKSSVPNAIENPTTSLPITLPKSSNDSPSSTSKFPLLSNTFQSIRQEMKGFGPRRIQAPSKEGTQDCCSEAYKSKVDEVTQRLTRRVSSSKCKCAGERDKRRKTSGNEEEEEVKVIEEKSSTGGTSKSNAREEERLMTKDIPPAEPRPKPIFLEPLLYTGDNDREQDMKQMNDLDYEMKRQEEKDAAEEQRFLREKLKFVPSFSHGVINFLGCDQVWFFDSVRN